VGIPEIYIYFDTSLYTCDNHTIPVPLSYNTAVALVRFISSYYTPYYSWANLPCLTRFWNSRVRFSGSKILVVNSRMLHASIDSKVCEQYRNFTNLSTGNYRIIRWYSKAFQLVMVLRNHQTCWHISCKKSVRVQSKYSIPISVPGATKMLERWFPKVAIWHLILKLFTRKTLRSSAWIYAGTLTQLRPIRFWMF
jgi:hypothetical protein